MSDILAHDLVQKTVALVAAEKERDALRAEVAHLDAVCAAMRAQVPTVVDDEFGLRIGGPDCEHPSLTGRRCDACGAAGAAS